MVAGAWATAAAPAPHPLTGAPGCGAPSPRVLAPTPHEIQVRLQTSGSGLPFISLRTWPTLLAPSAAEVVQCRRRRGWPRGREGCSNHSLLPLATTHGPTMAHRSASRTQMHLRVCLWVWPVWWASAVRGLGLWLSEGVCGALCRLANVRARRRRKREGATHTHTIPYSR